MVSLTRSFNTSTSGGIFFNDNSVSEDDAQLLQPAAGSNRRDNFAPLNTILLSAFHLSVAVGVFLVSVVLSAVNDASNRQCLSYFIVLYLHALFWCISWILHHLLKKKHDSLKIYGYLDFYKETEDQFRLPHHVVSAWSVLLLVVDSLLHQLYPDMAAHCESGGLVRPIVYLVVLLSLETIVLVICIGSYIRKVYKFNKKCPLPDAQRDEWLLQRETEGQRSASEVGYRIHSDHLQDLLERQADVITHLREHNARLSRKVMALSSRANTSHD
ncbi:transmembrane protein 192 [Schistocerca nitens]|uniref:transmembrane protein 192 n=1 Tax=Schistocerca nitens TaxID=7011 RepID=UPI0021192958|nr:transmembrane protein 192 [Schistocerca nitens]